MSIQGIYQSEYFTLCSAIGGRNEKSVLRLYVLADILLIIVFSYYIYGSGFMCQEEFNVVHDSNSVFVRNFGKWYGENGVSAWSKYRSSQTLFVRLRMFLNSKCHMFFSMKNLLSPSLHIIYVYFPDHLQVFFCISILIFTAFFP